MRLIDADWAERKAKEIIDGYAWAIRMAVGNAPTVDAVPVVHGSWIKGGYACGENEYKCSVCGETEWRTSSARMKYCMFCGAKMDGGEANADGT